MARHGDSAARISFGAPKPLPILSPSNLSPKNGCPFPKSVKTRMLQTRMLLKRGIHLSDYAPCPSPSSPANNYSTREAICLERCSSSKRHWPCANSYQRSFREANTSMMFSIICSNHINQGINLTTKIQRFRIMTQGSD